MRLTRLTRLSLRKRAPRPARVRSANRREGSTGSEGDEHPPSSCKGAAAMLDAVVVEQGEVTALPRQIGRLGFRQPGDFVAQFEGDRASVA